MKTKRVTYEFDNVIEREEYLDGRYGAPGERRAEKKKPTPEEVAQVNQWNKERKARHRLLKYFKENDYFITLTYQKEERPPNMEAAKADFRKFYLYCGKEYKKRGEVLRWIRNIECTPTGNWHIHVAVNRIPDTDIIISRAWKKGKVKNKQLLYEKGEFKKLAQYITKDDKTQEKYVEKGILDHKIKEADYNTSRNMPLPEPDIKHLKRWPKEPKPKEGWYIDKDSYFEGTNKVTGFPYRRYVMIRIERKEKCEGRDIHRNKRKRNANKKRKVRGGNRSPNKCRNSDKNGRGTRGDDNVPPDNHSGGSGRS